MIDLESERKLSFNDTFETRSLIVLKFTESIFSLFPFNPVNIDPPIFNEN